MKQTAFISTLIFGLLALNSCVLDEGEDVNYNELFPMRTIEDRWYFSDELGNSLTIGIVDTITDDGDRYYKTSFLESALNTESVHWFLFTTDELLYCPSLRGEYSTFLPKKFKEEGGDFRVDRNDVDYDIFSTYEISTGVFSDVVELRYEEPILNGFDGLVFANNIGPVRLVDGRGRWPVVYDLDSASLDGVLMTSDNF